MSQIEYMMKNMMRRFESIDQNVKKNKRHLFDIGQKVDAHAVLIKHL